MKIIAIAGFAGSGKSTFADYLYILLASNGYSVNQLAFGDRPKEIFAELKNMSTEQLFGDPTIKNQNRADLVAFAQSMKSIFGDDVWALSVVSQMHLNSSKDSVFIIPDLRFYSEIQTLEMIEGAEVHLVQMQRTQVRPKTTEDWYKTGKRHNILTADQMYQYYNLVDPNDLAMDTKYPFLVIDNSKGTDELQDQAIEYLKLINFTIKTAEKANV